MDVAKRLAGPAPGFERLLHSVLGVQRVGQMAVQQRIWPSGRRHHPADARLGGGGRALHPVGRGQDDVGGREVRRGLDDGLGMGARRVVGAVVAAQGGHAGPGGDLAGLQAQRREVVLLRLGQPTQPLQGLASVGVGFGMPRLETQRRLQHWQGVAGLVQIEQASGQGVGDRNVRGRKRHGPTQMGEGRFGPPGRLQRHGHDAEQHRRLDARVQRVVGEPCGPLQVPVVERRQDGADGRIVRRRIPARAGWGRRGGTADPEANGSRGEDLHHDCETQVD